MKSNLKIKEKRKALSPIIATILLIVVSVAIIGMIVSWGKDFTNKSISDTQNPVNLNTNDATHFIYNSDLKGQSLTFTYSPPNNLKNKDILINRYSIVGDLSIIFLENPITLREGINGINLDLSYFGDLENPITLREGINGINLDLSYFGDLENNIDLVLYTDNDEIITIKKINLINYQPPKLSNLIFSLEGVFILEVLL